jgi:hypothetical protein
MMACRCAMVEIASERFEGVLRHGRDAWLAEPTAVAIVEGICGLLDNATFRKHIIKQAYQRTRRMDWRDSARQIEAVLWR